MTTYKMETLIPIVAKLTEQYTSKESSSISYDKANQLMGAVLYCIQEYEQGKQNGDESYDLVTQEQLSAQEAYNRGIKCVEDKAWKLGEAYKNLMAYFNHYGNENLKDTATTGILGFLKYYDIKYAPQNTIITMDYPVLCQLQGLSGVDAVYEYIQAIAHEQRFLSNFSEKYICCILKRYNSNYEALFENLCSIILRNVLGHMMIKKPISEDGFNAKEYGELEDYIRAYDNCVLETEITKLLRELVYKGYQDDVLLFNYLKKDIPDFCVRLKHACSYNHLSTIFLL
ncbi:MAG: DUF6179 domain-containing protein [Cellulosilyticaceae bacterium]